MGLNGMSAEDMLPRKYRYMVQWVTEHDKTQGGAASIKVLGYCVRDRNTREWSTVFEHESHEVCEKVAKILNEG